MKFERILMSVILFVGVSWVRGLIYLRLFALECVNEVKETNSV